MTALCQKNVRQFRCCVVPFPSTALRHLMPLSCFRVCLRHKVEML